MKWPAFFRGLLALAILLVIAQPSFARDPKLVSVLPRAAKPSEVPRVWANYKWASLAFLAEASVLYSNENLYFLKRDADYLYALADALIPSNRIHQLIANRVNRKHPEFVRYLKQNGFDDETLQKQPAILIDTGYTGSIWERVRTLLPLETRSNVKAHFLTSNNPEIPQSEVFFAAIEAKSFGGYSLASISRHYWMYWLIEQGLPHLNERSETFRVVDGVVTPIETYSSGRAFELSTILLGDIKAFAAQENVQREFLSLQRNMSVIVEFLKGNAPYTMAREALELLGPIGLSYLKDIEQAHLRGTLSTDIPISKVVQLSAPDDRQMLEIRAAACSQYFL